MEVNETPKANKEGPEEAKSEIDLGSLSDDQSHLEMSEDESAKSPDVKAGQHAIKETAKEASQKSPEVNAAKPKAVEETKEIGLEQMELFGKVDAPKVGALIDSMSHVDLEEQ